MTEYTKHRSSSKQDKTSLNLKSASTVSEMEVIKGEARAAILQDVKFGAMLKLLISAPCPLRTKSYIAVKLEAPSVLKVVKRWQLGVRKRRHFPKLNNPIIFVSLTLMLMKINKDSLQTVKVKARQ